MSQFPVGPLGSSLYKLRALMTHPPSTSSDPPYAKPGGLQSRLRRRMTGDSATAFVALKMLIQTRRSTISDDCYVYDFIESIL